MKKILFVLMLTAALLSAALAENAVGMANPWTDCASLEELNEAAGTNLCLPGVMGVTDEAYRLLKTENGTIAELDFQVNGTAYTLRGSADIMDDISGVYMADGKTAFEGRDEEQPAYASADGMKLVRWNDVNAQYVLTVADNGTMDDETFGNIAEEMMDLTLPFHPIVLNEGSYGDETSQRAGAEVKALGSDTYAIEIHWAESADVDDVWTMTGVMTEDGLMNYSDCLKKQVTYANDGTETEVWADLIPDGYFVPLDENSFDWSGAAEEDCRDCRFVHPEE